MPPINPAPHSVSDHLPADLIHDSVSSLGNIEHLATIPSDRRAPFASDSMRKKSQLPINLQSIAEFSIHASIHLGVRSASLQAIKVSFSFLSHFIANKLGKNNMLNSCLDSKAVQKICAHLLTDKSASLIALFLKKMVPINEIVDTEPQINSNESRQNFLLSASFLEKMIATLEKTPIDTLYRGVGILINQQVQQSARPVIAEAVALLFEKKGESELKFLPFLSALLLIAGSGAMDSGVSKVLFPDKKQRLHVGERVTSTVKKESLKILQQELAFKQFINIMSHMASHVGIHLASAPSCTKRQLALLFLTGKIPTHLLRA